MPNNECIPYYEDGEQITVALSGTLVGKTFVVPNGNLNADGLIVVGQASSAGAAFGVLAYDGVTGDRVPVRTGPGMVVPVTASGTIAAGAEVQVGAAGSAVVFSAGIKVGLCLTGATNGNDAMIKLYH